MREIEHLSELTAEAIREHEAKFKEIDSLESGLEDIEQQLSLIDKKIKLYEGSQLLLQNLAEVTRNDYAADLEKVVTLCLQSVFGEHKSFEIEIKPSRNKVAVEFYVVDTSGSEPLRRPPEDSMGGGVVDTVSIGLRFGLLQLVNPKPLGPIILDEPAKHVSSGKVDAISTLILELTRMFNKQTILVTHHQNLVDIADNAITFDKKDGYTVILA